VATSGRSLSGLRPLFFCRREKGHDIVDLWGELRQRNHGVGRTLRFVAGRISSVYHTRLDQGFRRARDSRPLATGKIGVWIMADYAIGHIDAPADLDRSLRLRRPAAAEGG